jgi:Rps23 Pro-64 3,4-dihydroxylase Tpa1-like proline 4-hydroxylase
METEKATEGKKNSYKHGVLGDLVAPGLLRAVRAECRTALAFARKQTDIYTLQQSGDLTNLDGLGGAARARLPALRRLRDALYSRAFRGWLARVTGAGALSGTRTDMAVNVYTPGCHLLCHDDVIGSRRVSYILYLTDPERPWRREWGGALRLYPTTTVATTTTAGVDGEGGRDGGGGKEGGGEGGGEGAAHVVKIPSPDSSVSIPPAFNQLSFFAVQPGESFHDVEEVYAAAAEETGGEGKTGDGGNAAPDSDRVRMAISGWFHIPQPGEDGYVAGLEEQLARESSLAQLQGKATSVYDLPQSQVHFYADDGENGVDGAGDGANAEDNSDETRMLTEGDLDYLLKFIAPAYLTPDTLDALADRFADESCLRLDAFLAPRFADRLRRHVEQAEREALPQASADIERTTAWRVARPPHKHRFLYQHAPTHSSSSSSSSSSRGGSGSGGAAADVRQKNGEQGEAAQAEKNGGREQEQGMTPIQELLAELLPSAPFRKWLGLATREQLESCSVLARRFRRGHDYTLATGAGPDSRTRLELTLGITPTTGWGDDDDDADEEGEENEEEEEDEEEEGEEEDEGRQKQGKNRTKAADGRPGRAAAVAAAAAAAAAANGMGNHQLKAAHAEGSSSSSGGGGGDGSRRDKAVDSVGGYEMYMAGDDDDDGATPADPAVYKSSSSRRARRRASSSANDGKGTGDDNGDDGEDDDGEEDDDDDDDDDGVLFSLAAGWNRMSIVLRDQGALRFVKYVSRAAPGDRWDVTAEYGLRERDDDDDDNDNNDDSDGGSSDSSDDSDV